MINYQIEMDKLLKSNTEKGVVPSLMLHSCCAPCSSYVIEYLSNYFYITVLYYNPNITKESEYSYRLSEEKRLIGEMKTKYPVKMLDAVYCPDKYLEAVKGLEHEPEGGKRCEKCFEMRLFYTAKSAKERGFDFFATTLTISPLKNAKLINEIGFNAEKKFGVKHLASDFKKRGGYKRSIELSKQYDLYRQNYCGCIFSAAERKRAESERPEPNNNTNTIF